MQQHAMAPQAPDTQEPEYHTDMPVGEILRRTRVHYGLSLSEVERALRIRESLINAIETGDQEKLPGRVYAIGFVRSYAEYLGFDGAQIIDLYKRQCKTSTMPCTLDFPVGDADNNLPPLWLIMVSLLIVVALGAGVFWVSGSPYKAQEVVPTVNEIEQSAAQKDVTEDRISNPVSVEDSGIFLNVTENSWVEISDSDGNPLVSRILKEGEKFYVPNRPDLRISMGNPAGIQIRIDGQPIPSLGERGETVKDIALGAESLKALAAAQP